MSNVRRIAAVTAVTALSAFAFALATATTPALAAPRGPEPTTVSVSGEGGSSRAPDMALLTAGVEATKPTAKEAMAAQGKAAQALLDAVAKQGIADRDVKTEGLTLGPQYDYTGGTPKLLGYEAGQSFTLKIRDIAKTGAVISAVAAATGDAGRINGVSFDVSDRQSLEAEARDAAFRNAGSKAEQYAKLGNRKLGRLVSVSEHGDGAPVPYKLPMAAAMEAAGPTPVATGEVKSTVSVSVVYELT